MPTRVATFLAAFLLTPAFLQAATWRGEVVDASGPGKFSSLRLDASGNVHVAYVVDDGKRYPLKYAFWDHGLNKWFVMTVAENSGPCSLTLDSKQRPHISYVDFGTSSGSKLRYAHWDGTAWISKAIPLNSDVIGYYNSIVLDASDRPSISFYEYRGPKDTEIRLRLRVVNWTGESWQVRTVDSQEGSGKFNSMAIDDKGNKYLAYANVSSGTAGVRYAFWGGSSWKPEIVDGADQNGGASVGYSVCLALDFKGNPHLAYMNESSPMIKYATRSSDSKGQWHVQTIEPLSGVAYPDRNSIALDAEGTPFIGYYDSGRGVLKVAHPEGARWLVEVVDSNASGFTSSLQISKEFVWVSYSDDANGGLKVARREVIPKQISATPKEPGNQPTKR
jgi:hypothetical protein